MKPAIIPSAKPAAVRPASAKRARALTLAIAVLLTASGCSPDWYKADADRQVDKLLSEQKRQALAYEPLSEAIDKPTPDAPHEPYRRVPVTPIVLSTGRAVEPATVEVPFGVSGPVNVQTADTGVDLADFRTTVWDRLDNEFLVLGPPSPKHPVVRFDLFAALTYATNNSRDYANNMEELYLSALDVTLQRHLLSPRPFVSQRVAFDGNQSEPNYRSAMTAVTTAGVRQTLPYGGEVVAQSLTTFVEGLNSTTQDGESATAAITASIPLLRGAGLVNLEGLINSERTLVYTIRNFEVYRRSFLVDVSTRYLNLLTTRSAVFNRRQNLVSNVETTERTRVLVSAGKNNYLDLQRALNSQFSAENSLITAEASYRQALDSFKVFIGMPVEEQLEVLPVELDVAIPETSYEDAVRLAHLYRLDLQTARDRIDDAQRQVNIAQNGLLPDLNLDAATNFGARDATSTTPRGYNNENTSYSVGATLDLPVDRVAERNQYRRTLIRLQQAQRSFNVSRDNATAAARNALRQIQSAQDQVELSKRNVQVSQNRLDLANRLLTQPLLNGVAGLSSSNRDVVEAQGSLLEAQDDLDNARAQLQIQVLNYYRDTGTLRIDPASGTLGRALARKPNVTPATLYPSPGLPSTPPDPLAPAKVPFP